MNRPLRSSSSRATFARSCGKCFSVGLLTSAFLVASEMPLLANPPQAAQPSSDQSNSSQTSSSQTGSHQTNSGQTSSGQSGASQPGTATQRTDDSLPDAPQATTPPSQTGQQQPEVAPSGTAGAKAATVKGAPVAQPAGAAVAPARQRGHRSLLIKLGLLAGAGIAVGTVVALSAKSQPRPPGASPAVQP